MANCSAFARRRSRIRRAVKKKSELEAFDVATHLRTPEEMAAYLDACIVESDGDSAFIAKALGDIARALSGAVRRAES